MCRRRSGPRPTCPAMCSCNPSCHSSSKMVTGPSLTNSTCMWAPKIPVSTPPPSSRRACTNAATNGSAAAPGAAAFQDGRRPLAVSAYSVNWLTTMIGAFMSEAARSSSRILSCQSFSASRRALSTSSLCVTREIGGQGAANRILERLRYQDVRYQFHVSLLPGRLVKGANEHYDIIDAVLAGDPVAAEQITRDHFMGG